ncbi:MAG: hypothetical protein GY832_24295 [Chloroflexi bacterium]|nr:hypothetical protein [Chloroflexota bacterium]
MTQGICYLFSGNAVAERLMVSIHSLRDHWQGPVSVLATVDDCEEIAKRAADDLSIDVIRVKPLSSGRNSSYLNKSMVPAWTPYDETLFIDADTLIVGGDLNDLFGHQLTITQFSDWQSQGRRIAKRINGFRGKTPAIDALIDEQLAVSYPAINTGVFCFRKNHLPLAKWASITVAAAGTFISDEIAMQLLQADMEEGEDYRVIDDRWNCSPTFGTHKDEAKIWHFHGDKHIKKPQGRELWLPAFERTKTANIGGLAEWAGKYDKYVRAM